MNCKEGNRNIIAQINTLLDQMDNETYAKPLELFKGSSIGQHFRHIMDFYRCLLKGVALGTVDYANRDRNLLAESDVEYAKNAFDEIAASIDQLAENLAIQVRGDFSSQMSTERPMLFSSVGRELMFAYDHAVHHLAMIKIGIEATAPQMQLEENLGVAPSTIKYWATNAVLEG